MKMTLALTLIALIVAPSVFAGGQTGNNTSGATSGTQCVQLTGIYHGQCNVSVGALGDTAKDQIKIEQEGCEVLNVNGTPLLIGMKNIFRIENLKGNAIISSSYVPQWNNGLNTMTINGSVNVGEPNDALNVKYVITRHMAVLDFGGGFTCEYTR